MDKLIDKMMKNVKEMNVIIEEMMKDREAVHPKCQGVGFAESDKVFIRADRCGRIEPVENMDDPSQPADFMNEACRCTAYISPSYWWTGPRSCPLANHFRPDLKPEIQKGRIGQQKQKKRKK